jgi:hypothetical protein
VLITNRAYMCDSAVLKTIMAYVSENAKSVFSSRDSCNSIISIGNVKIAEVLVVSNGLLTK